MSYQRTPHQTTIPARQTSLVLSLIVRSVMLSVMALVFIGCGKQTGVGVIDLDRVASALGWMDDLGKNLQTADTEMRAQLDQVLRANVKTIEDTKAEVAADAKLTADQIKTLNSIQDVRELAQLPLTKEQREKLINAVNDANTRWQNALNAYQQQIQQQRVNLILGCREKIRPAARRVATARGLAIVLTTSDNVLLSEPGTDITNDVIDELQKSGTARVVAPSAAPAPATPAPVAPAKQNTKQ
ncbi:MAG: OmpH family outer membrane protein [Verrucomicrobia bacterium]|nr:OmpH family outer membrane protein [Verrucomicrobiota bacterium]